ncbi:unnamed protein product [Fusarium langsethiae]|nr:unnamed protein product [Fusarium langsethiae]
MTDMNAVLSRNKPILLSCSTLKTDKVFLVIGEYLQNDPPNTEHLTLPRRPLDFYHKRHYYIPTKERTVLVVGKISSKRVILYRLLKCEGGVWTAGPLSRHVHEHIYFYSEFTEGTPSTERDKAKRYTKLKESVAAEAKEVFESYNTSSIDLDDTESVATPVTTEQAEPDSLLAQATYDVHNLLSATNLSARNHSVLQETTDVFEKLFRRHIVNEEGARAVAEQCVALWRHDCPVPAILALAQSICKGALGQIDEEAYLARASIYNFCALYEVISSIADHDALALKAYQEVIEILDTMLNIQGLQLRAIDETREADRARIPDVSKLLDDTVRALDHPSAVESVKRLLVPLGEKHDGTMGRVADMIGKQYEGLLILRETLIGYSEGGEDDNGSHTEMF